MEIKTNTRDLTEKIVGKICFASQSLAAISKKNIEQLLKEAGIPEPINEPSAYAFKTARGAFITERTGDRLFLTSDIPNDESPVLLSKDRIIPCQRVLAQIIDREIEAVHKKYAPLLAIAKQIVEHTATTVTMSRYENPLLELRSVLSKLSESPDPKPENVDE